MQHRRSPPPRFTRDVPLMSRHSSWTSSSPRPFRLNRSPRLLFFTVLLVLIAGILVFRRSGKAARNYVGAGLGGADLIRGRRDFVDSVVADGAGGAGISQDGGLSRAGTSAEGDKTGEVVNKVVDEVGKGVGEEAIRGFDAGRQDVGGVEGGFIAGAGSQEGIGSIVGSLLRKKKEERNEGDSDEQDDEENPPEKEGPSKGDKDDDKNESGEGEDNDEGDAGKAEGQDKSQDSNSEADENKSGDEDNAQNDKEKSEREEEDAKADEKGSDDTQDVTDERVPTKDTQNGNHDRESTSEREQIPNVERGNDNQEQNISKGNPGIIREGTEEDTSKDKAEGPHIEASEKRKEEGDKTDVNDNQSEPRSEGGVDPPRLEDLSERDKTSISNSSFSNSTTMSDKVQADTLKEVFNEGQKLLDEAVIKRNEEEVDQKKFSSEKGNILPQAHSLESDQKSRVGVSNGQALENGESHAGPVKPLESRLNDSSTVHTEDGANSAGAKLVEAPSLVRSEVSKGEDAVKAAPIAR